MINFPVLQRYRFNFKQRQRATTVTNAVQVINELVNLAYYKILPSNDLERPRKTKKSQSG
jgi:hypothetical protein